MQDRELAALAPERGDLQRDHLDRKAQHGQARDDQQSRDQVALQAQAWAATISCPARQFVVGLSTAAANIVPRLASSSLQKIEQGADAERVRKLA